MVHGAWRHWNVGDEVVYTVNEFDGKGTWHGIVTEKHDDHLIVEADGMHLWCDDVTGDLFSKYAHLKLGGDMVEIDILKGERA